LQNARRHVGLGICAHALNPAALSGGSFPHPTFAQAKSVGIYADAFYLPKIPGWLLPTLAA